MNDLTIRIDPALPCCTVIGPDLLCGKLASVATVYPAAGGNFILQPFCKDCVQALAAIYGPAGDLFPPAEAEQAEA